MIPEIRERYKRLRRKEGEEIFYKGIFSPENLLVSSKQMVSFTTKPSLED
jgi:hypothetical protein